MAVVEQDIERLLPESREDNNTSSDSGDCGEGGPPRRGPLRWVSVEPVVLVSVFGLGLAAVFHDNLWLDKICSVYFGYDKEVCSALNDGHHPQEEKAVQKVASHYRVYAKVVEQVLGLVMVVVMGGCSDALDRRLPLLCCHTGFLLMALTSAANVYWWWLPPEMLLLNYFMLGLGGGTLVLSVGVEAYVSAASIKRYRTTRLAVVKVMAVAGKVLGEGVALPVFRSGGYLAVFGSQSLAFVAVIMYVLLWLERRPGEIHVPAIPQQQQQRVVSLASLKSIMLVICQSRGHGGRRRLLAHMCIVWLRLFSLGSFSFLFFSARERFQWSYKTFTVWSVIDVMVSLLGLLVTVPAISYFCQAKDGLLGLLGSFSLIFKNVMAATAPRAWVLYLASAAGVCGEVVGVASRGAISKLVRKQRLGAVFAILAIGEGVVPVLSATVFDALYTATYTVFPGAVFVLSTFCCFLMSCVFVWEESLYGTDPAGEDDTAAGDNLANAPSPPLPLPDTEGDDTLSHSHSLTM